MFAAFLTTIFFSLSVVFAARSARALGGPAANFARLILATAVLGIWAHSFGHGLRGVAFPWFFLSGVIGFGLGDMSLFGALTRLGPRLAILLTQCLAAPIAAITEWLWLGTTLTNADLTCGAVILLGVAVALAPDHGTVVSRGTFWVGALFGVGSALGQAFGAVLSRKANELADGSHFPIDGGTAAYQRIVGGVLVTAMAFFALRKMRGARELPPAPGRWRRAWPMVAANAVSGPVLGVACFQWALQATPSGIVLPIVATSPVVTIALSFLIDGTRASRRAILGGVLAVGGAVALKLVHSGNLK